MASDQRIRVVACLQDGLITTEQALHLGLSTSDIRTRVRRREWRALTRGVLLIDADLYADGLPERTWWRAALLAQGPGSFLVANTAVRAFGIQGLPPATAIEVAVPGGVSRLHRRSESAQLALGIDGPKLVVRQLVVPPGEVVEVHGFRARAAVESLIDTGLNSSRPVALSILDSALHLKVVTQDELDWAVLRAAGRRGVVALRRLVQIADGRAESPLESRVRLICVDGGIPPTDLQHVVRDDYENVIAIGDMAWIYRRRRPLLAEADGADVHSTPKAVFRDRVRGNALTARSYDTVRFTWQDTHRPAWIVGTVRAALSAA
jgi:hypothetical protein